ncbi:hypothetical protein QBC34DRAFT_412475 [Podospora aff. communis PSN243]|uniref:ABM domain-containing protein n=1 Tax=Podospora aff. communis PSN243 TaxID=3040156 RepID=A0AAV9GCM9_9PEZI|nr:hypothetical protein QBC34DRAFT_412475 [Podospora aff. communis PSN243]
MSSTDSTPALLSNLPPIPEDEFCVFGRVYAHPAHADALEQTYALTTHLAASEPGIIHYCIARDEEDPTMFHFFERFTGREAFEAHNKQPVIVKLLTVDLYIDRVEAKFVRAVKPRGRA